MSHWHRRGKPIEARTPAWDGWTCYPCTEKGCDWAVYVAPNHREHVGYIPSATRPGNVGDPADVEAVAKRERVITEVGAVDPTTGEVLGEKVSD